MRILIVEDEPAVSRLIARFLQPVATESPLIAATMKEAKDIIGTTNPIDLVTLDLLLPDSSAEQTLASIKEIKALKPDCLLIVLTGMMRPGQREEALAQGADGFMQKTEVFRDTNTFFGTLIDIARSVVSVPSRYQRNISLVEKIAEKICDYTTQRQHNTA